MYKHKLGVLNGTHIFYHSIRTFSRFEGKMVKRFIGNGRLQEGGQLATHKQDFNAHVTGGDWRHDATQVDMSPPIPGLGGATVQEALENLLSVVQSSGTGFVSIGQVDGYALGSYNVGATGISDLRDALLAAFADERLTNGGVVLILAGTYTMTAQVEIPAGISLMGEIAGTIINGEMTAQSMFKVVHGGDRPNIGGDTGSGETSLNPGSPIDETRFTNLILVDNLNGNITDSGYVVSSMQTKPMIEMEISSRVVCEGVKFIGRLNNAATVTGRGKTLRAIGTVSSGDITADTLSTHLTVRSCYFDGMQTAIDFSPDNGALDTLTIDKCKARIFGEEDTPTSIAANSFVTISQCNASITNNYVLDGGDSIYGFCVVTSGDAADSEDVFVTISGNTGESALQPVKTIYFDGTGSNLATRSVIVGNNWSSALNNGWFITVGNNTSAGDGTCGDFNGPGAIDLLMSMNTDTGAARHEHPVNVYVGEGVYTVTFEDDGYNGADRFNFIGTSGATRPRFELAIGSGASTDELGNLIFKVGKKLSNIHFQAATGTSIQSVRLTGDDADKGSVLVEHCAFTDIALTMEQPSGSSVINLAVINCQFLQTGTYSDNASILLPNLEHTLLQGCTFDGAGYAGLIGEQTGYTNNRHKATVTLRDCIFDKTGYTIDDASPLADIGSYLVIDAGASNNYLYTYIENCKFLANENTNSVTTDAIINASLDASILRFVYVRSREVSIDNCVFHGPNTTFAVGATDYPLPALEVVPGDSLHLTNSRFLSRGLCLKVGGDTLALSNGFVDGVWVDSNIFFSGSSGSMQSTSMIDMELTPSVTSGPTKVNFTNNKVGNRNLQSPNIEPYHPIFSGIKAAGLINIFAESCDVFVSGNSIDGSLGDGGSTSSIRTLAGLVVENSNDGTGTYSAQCNVSNNRIAVLGDVVSSDQDAWTAWINGVEITVTGNSLLFDNKTGTVGSKDFGCLFIENRVPTVVSSICPPAVVTENTFSRHPIKGGPPNDITTYIMISSGSEGGGKVVDNVFDSPTETSGDNRAFEDNSPSSEVWLVDRNKNQKVVRVYKTAAYDPIDSALWTGGNFGSVSCQATGSTSNANWQFYDLPHGAEITRLRVGVRAGLGHGSLPGASDIAAFTLEVGNVSSGTHAAASVVPAGPYVDSSASVAAYELYHFIDSGNFSTTHIVDNENETLLLNLNAETGANRAAGLEYRFVEVTMILP